MYTNIIISSNWSLSLFITSFITSSGICFTFLPFRVWNISLLHHEKIVTNSILFPINSHKRPMSFLSNAEFFHVLPPQLASEKYIPPHFCSPLRTLLFLLKMLWSWRTGVVQPKPRPDILRSLSTKIREGLPFFWRKKWLKVWGFCYSCVEASTFLPKRTNSLKIFQEFQGYLQKWGCF